MMEVQCVVLECGILVMGLLWQIAKVASHDGSAVCCVGMWNPGDWEVEKFFV